MAESTASDPRWFRKVLGQYPTGVCAVTASESDSGRAGFVVGSFTSVSLDPPLIAFFPDKGSTSWPRIQAAGRFCVNILSADQEFVCRQFAAKGADKFAGITVRETSSGSPIIDGAVAWIDCELGDVYEAGDHYAVFGKVLDLDIESGELPLLFFQGGYGRFSPLSMAAPESRKVSADRLRQVDTVRSEMERLAADVGARCIATCVEDDRLVVLAAAGGAESHALPTLVGTDLPFVPPNGSALAAWREPAAIEEWVKVLPESARAAQRRRLEVVRKRGYSLGLISEAQREFASALDELARDPLTPAGDGLTELATRLSYDPEVLDDEIRRAVRVVAVPVFDADGAAALALTLYGFTEPDAHGGIDAIIERACETSRAATKKLGGRLPV
ncbi:flavin reductase family protein [Mycolicibacterium litorale]|uniref:flavin reductase family protein n=1 Tax=Mycolicibacterium litorale TaxID=758802 RepID=UPI003CF22184